jgi:hypothetical protein
MLRVRRQRKANEMFAGHFPRVTGGDERVFADRIRDSEGRLLVARARAGSAGVGMMLRQLQAATAAAGRLTKALQPGSSTERGCRL